jgi:hypothetical protein
MLAAAPRSFVDPMIFKIQPNRKFAKPRIRGRVGIGD